MPRRIDPARYRAVLARVREIPEGFVRAYGDVSPGAPRFAGQVLHAHGEEVPWWRVVRADGSLAKGDHQRALLEAEGVPFVGARVDPRAFVREWAPDPTVGPPTTAPRTRRYSRRG